MNFNNERNVDPVKITQAWMLVTPKIRFLVAASAKIVIAHQKIRTFLCESLLPAIYSSKK